MRRESFVSREFNPSRFLASIVREDPPIICAPIAIADQVVHSGLSVVRSSDLDKARLLRRRYIYLARVIVAQHERQSVRIALRTMTAPSAKRMAARLAWRRSECDDGLQLAHR